MAGVSGKSNDSVTGLPWRSGRGIGRWGTAGPPSFLFVRGVASLAALALSNTAAAAAGPVLGCCFPMGNILAALGGR